MTLEEKNRLLFIKNYNIDITLLPQIAKTRKDPFIIEDAKNGNPTLKIGDKYIHSRYNPAAEADKTISASEHTGYDCWVFGGFGLGYYLESFLRYNKNAKAVVVEPDPEIFLTAAAARDLEYAADPERVIYIIGAGADTIVPTLNALQCDTIYYFQIRSEYSLDSDYYENLKSSISSYMSRKEINNNTLKRFGKTWVKNLSQNLPLFAVSPGINSLAGKFAGMPAFIAAGGPGLDKVTGMLKEISRRHVMIAVDTSLSALLLNGVTPDFTIVVDPQYWNFRHLDRCIPGNSILVSEPSTYSRVFRPFGKNVFFSGSVFPLNRFFESRSFSRGKIGAGGSVATSAWDIARQAGCSSVLFGGLDLCYPGRQTHFKGSFFEERAHTFSSRLNPAALMDYSLFTDGSLIAAQDNTGKPVYTDRRLIIYKNWFEEQIVMHRFKTETLSSGGLKINGITPVSIEDILEKPDIRKTIDTVLKELRAMIEGREKESAMEALLKTAADVEELTEILENIKETAEQGIEAAQNLLSGNFAEKTAKQKYLKILDKTDALLMAGETRHIAGFLLQEVTRKINAEGGGKTFEETIGYSLELYENLIESVDYHKKYLDESIKRIKKTVCLDVSSAHTV